VENNMTMVIGKLDSGNVTRLEMVGRSVQWPTSTVTKLLLLDHYSLPGRGTCSMYFTGISVGMFFRFNLNL
jgi:hypothetical protein